MTDTIKRGIVAECPKCHAITGHLPKYGELLVPAEPTDAEIVEADKVLTSMLWRAGYAPDPDSFADAVRDALIAAREATQP